MLDLTWVDYAYVGVLIASTVWATIRGGVYETIATLSWVIAAVAARFLSPMLDKLLQGWFGVSESTVGTLVASYFIVFFVILLIVGFFNQKLRDMIHASMMSVTDHTLGVIFGIVRGVVVMGVCYWAALWYFSDSPMVPHWLTGARTRPIMQMTAIKLDEWFIPGAENKLLKHDLEGTRQAQQIFDNLINPRVVDKAAATKPEPDNAKKTDDETGYKNSERTSLENQLLQIESVAKAIEQHEKAQKE